MKVLITCPPMLGMLGKFRDAFVELGWEVTAPEVSQIMSERDLIGILPAHDGWIIGDDPASRQVLTAASKGRLRAAVKWGVGTDNVDFSACEELGIRITNTPNMFGAEVADIAVGYIVGLARETFLIDREVRSGLWPKPAGISLAGKTVGIVGLGDIGCNVAKRLLAADMRIFGYDPCVDQDKLPSEVSLKAWHEGKGELDFLVITCALSNSSFHMVNRDFFRSVKPGIRLINVSRGPVVDEVALVEALDNAAVHSAALDVFEVEPLPMSSRLRGHTRCIFGSHNASNTADAVIRTSAETIQKLEGLLMLKSAS
ncbi:phosphoglycerate dehydrogenase [Luminiphilus sp.]|nr:phosphoglycerate dehydrogenase [Luminiphilus sp.]MDA8986210.1 phosphoglycerate dehydrogenase [Luminiphilus sp.]